MLLSILAVAAVALTCVMFTTRNLLLGFPSAIFWAILGGYCYQQSTTTWDIYYLFFFASMGMTIFCLFAMYTLRKKDLGEPDADKGKFIDEGPEPDLRGDVEKNSGNDNSEDDQVSPRVQEVRDRAAKRRSHGSRRKPGIF